MTALKVKPYCPVLFAKFIIAKFLAISVYVKCQPKLSGDPDRITGLDWNICSSTAPFPFPAFPILLPPQEKGLLGPLILQVGDISFEPR